MCSNKVVSFFVELAYFRGDMLSFKGVVLLWHPMSRCPLRGAPSLCDRRGDHFVRMTLILADQTHPCITRMAIQMATIHFPLQQPLLWKCIRVTSHTTLFWKNSAVFVAFFYSVFKSGVDTRGIKKYKIKTCTSPSC